MASIAPAAGRGLIIPTPRTATGVPGAERPFTQTASGLFVPARAGVQALTPRQIVVPPKEVWGDLRAERMLQWARQGHAEIAKADGRPAADILLAPQARVLDAVAAQERHDRVVQMFMRNRREYQAPPTRT